MWYGQKTFGVCPSSTLSFPKGTQNLCSGRGSEAEGGPGPSVNWFGAILRSCVEKNVFPDGDVSDHFFPFTAPNLPEFGTCFFFNAPQET